MIFNRSMNPLNDNDLDTRLFRAFRFAADENSFTGGAQKAGMTQSGMSQNIARLEEQMGCSLFERVNKKVLLTPEGKQLRKFVDDYEESLQSFLLRINKERFELNGRVRYAMPDSCLKTPHFPLLLKKRESFPNIDLEVELLDSKSIFSSVLDGSIDFGFVTELSENPALKFDEFAQEEYVLVSANPKEITSISPKNLTMLKFVDYPGMKTRFDIWRQHFFSRKQITYHDIKFSGTINDLDGAITMTLGKVGCTVIPTHCIQEYLMKKELFCFKMESKNQPVGKIFIVTRNDFKPPARVETILNAFGSMN